MPFSPRLFKGIGGTDIDIDTLASAWSIFIDYVSERLYPSFLELHADTEAEANALADGFMAKLYDLLRGKSIKLTFDLRVTGGSIQ